MKQEIINRAIDKIATLYNAKKRGASNRSLICYLITVFLLLQAMDDSLEVLVGALLYGVLRDSDAYQYGQLRSELGIEIAQIVESLTEYKGTRGEERQRYI